MLPRLVRFHEIQCRMPVYLEPTWNPSGGESVGIPCAKCVSVLACYRNPSLG